MRLGWILLLVSTMSTSVESRAANAGERRTAGAWTINAAGLRIIRQFEGLRLTAYREGKVWRIGYGHGGAAPGQTISAAAAETLLRRDLRGCEGAVGTAVEVPINRNEFSALVSLCFTINERRFKASEVVALLNDDKRDEAAQAFRQWVQPAGLAARRRREMTLFLN
ncbi:MAG: lysozyme [Burkholderiales bacterium]|nr:lysozyme [Burkholderiales bacterium]